MPSGCSIRALWILNNQDAVVFSRRFPVVERRWQVACQIENQRCVEGGLNHVVSTFLPTDSELSAAFVDRKRREGSARGFGIRVAQSTKGSDSWIDDPITRHILSLCIKKEEEEEENFLWPLILHVKGPYFFLVLPLTEPHHLKEYARMCRRSDCGNAVGIDGKLSSLLLDLPSITGAFMFAHTIGDIITGDAIEPEVVVTASPSVGGLLDSLTGSIGISARAKPVAAPVAASSSSGAAMSGAVISDAPKIGSRPVDKDALQTFITSSMPFGTPLDLSFSNISTIKVNGFTSADLPPADRKQPAWKPYLFKGKQRILFTIHETVHAAMYDRDEIPDNVSISGQVNCRAELEGLPDVLFPLIGLDTARVEVLSFHHCVQVPEHGGDKQAVMFSPPLGNFILMRYQASCAIGPPVKGFYQLSMVSENEGAFLFRLRLMEGYKAPLTMEFCTVTMPFPRRKVVSFDGTPSIGTVSASERSVEWKIVLSGRGAGKSVEATFPGTVKFAPWQTQKQPSSGASLGIVADDDSDVESEPTNSMVNVEDFLIKKMNKELQSVDLEEPFSWQAYDYAKVSFKMVGASLSGMSIDSKSVCPRILFPSVAPALDIQTGPCFATNGGPRPQSSLLKPFYLFSYILSCTFLVSIFPSVKAPVEFSTQVTSGDYILWNTLGKCPVAATQK